jgi:hypothetical protein
VKVEAELVFDTCLYLRIESHGVERVDLQLCGDMQQVLCQLNTHIQEDQRSHYKWRLTSRECLVYQDYRFVLNETKFHSTELPSWLRCCPQL